MKIKALTVLFCFFSASIAMGSLEFQLGDEKLNPVAVKTQIHQNYRYLEISFTTDGKDYKIRIPNTTAVATHYGLAEIERKVLESILNRRLNLSIEIGSFSNRDNYYSVGIMTLTSKAQLPQ